MTVEGDGAADSVARVLFDVRVRRQLVRRDREQVAERLRRAPRLDPPLPLPDAVVGEAVVPDEVLAAVRLPEQLARALVEDEVEGELGVGDVPGGAAVAAPADLVHVVERRRAAPPAA